MAKRQWLWFQQPSWWIVVIAGALLVTFVIAIVRELINSHDVQSRVHQLQSQVATEQQRQQQLQDLIEYLGSPTFQEQEARLKLGLKKDGEQVIVVPANPVNTSNTSSATSGAATVTSNTTTSHPDQWWQYFFGPSSPRT